MCSSDPPAAAIATGEVTVTRSLDLRLTVGLEGAERGRTIEDPDAAGRPIRVVTGADDHAASLVRARILAPCEVARA